MFATFPNTEDIAAECCNVDVLFPTSYFLTSYDRAPIAVTVDGAVMLTALTSLLKCLDAERRPHRRVVDQMPSRIKRSPRRK